ncbi:hypothetical protein [Methanolobus bombayensis]|uniref:hypothetical protein n=1 Tax=Methanolobus bombayensis TaxID=38023 RepID=UPI001AE6BF9E|nr:hypothetical protein [Methanolobus bombayensis]MBP1908981.1 hypothetical protein [Methanolobus bombayensis]
MTIDLRFSILKFRDSSKKQITARVLEKKELYLLSDKENKNNYNKFSQNENKNLGLKEITYSGILSYLK